MIRKIEISHRTIIFTVLFLLALWILYQIREIIVAIFVAMILMSALNPIVDRLERIHFPRWAAILLLYILIFVLLGLVLSVWIPLLVDQTTNFIDKMPLYLGELGRLGIDSTLINSQLSQLGLLPANVLKLTVGIFSNLVTVFFIAIVTFYLLLERKKLNHYLALIFGEKEEERAEKLIGKAEKQLGGWVRGEVILMTVIGVMVFAGLQVLGIEFALPLAILAGLLEIVPNIGPIISAVPGILIGLSISPLMGLGVAAMYFLVQQIENSIVVPKVMEKVVGVNPLIIILALSIGFKLGGGAGAILALPVILVLQILMAEFFSSNKD